MKIRRATTEPVTVLLFDPRVEGHHASWIHYLADDLVSGGYRVILACDWREAARARLERELGDTVSRIQIQPIFDAQGKVSGGSMLGALKAFHREWQPDFAFLCNFNEIASALFRDAALGLLPPQEFRGCLGGVYHRPTMLLTGRFSANQWLKRVGFRRLARNGWFSPLFFTDESLLQRLQGEVPDAELRYLVTPGAGRFGVPTEEARVRLGIPTGRFPFLFYGGPYRRKGLHLTLDAFESLPADHPAFLICAGDQSQDADVVARLRQLEQQGRALLIGRYISSEDELTTLAFCASEAVLLPYIHFLTASGVMAQACAAGKPVLASDVGWLGKQVRRFNLGLLYPQNDWESLKAAMVQFIQRSPREGAQWRENARKYTAGNNRQVFREQLLAGFSSTATATLRLSS
jgi:glycosyltransferase involved in cell wall biosynthesis